eukprot:TRINITY_DN2829_c0_g1_i2.p1 TRINITY_DN2829_c0_g1~~TRINITY_DN2829_c0_g1_i2.p1  ORF type:complete len:406 (+),score=41.77 TRINITY_DN2829_c0_g1_i2:1-1218(+)
MDTSLYSLLSGDKRAVVLDIGAHLTKFGSGGDPIPSIIPTHLRTLNNVQISLSSSSSPSFSSAELEEAFFLFLQKLLVGHLLCDPKETPIILCENIYMTSPVRQAAASALFLRLQVPSIVFLPHQPAAVLATSQHSALVVDIGHSQCSIVPVVNRLVLRGGLTSFPVGGHSVADRLSTLLKEYPSQYDLEASKAQGKDVMQALESEIEDAELHRLIQNRVSLDAGSAASNADSSRYPIGQNKPIVIDLKRDVTEQAAQVLFEVDEDGSTLSHTILDTIIQSNIDVRGVLISHILLLGGISLIPGLRSKLHEELKRAIQSGPTRFRALEPLLPKIAFVDCPLSPLTMGWIGASLLSTVYSVLRESEMERSRFVELGTCPDWSSLLSNEKRIQLFKSAQNDNPLLSF